MVDALSARRFLHFDLDVGRPICLVMKLVAELVLNNVHLCF